MPEIIHYLGQCFKFASRTRDPVGFGFEVRFLTLRFLRLWYEPMRRETLIAGLASGEEFDVLVIGGGATGLGTAVESAARGYRTLLLEQHDFCKGTSSKSTKLIHGGVRYLAQGNISLVVDALRERGILLRNAPSLVKIIPLIVPLYRHRERAYYGLGLKLYDVLAGRLGLGKTRFLSAEEVKNRLPTIRSSSLRGGVLFYDAQFDDSRLGIALVRTLARLGGLPINYVAVERLFRQQDAIGRIRVRDQFSGREFQVRSQVVVNATGVFSDRLRSLVCPGVEPRISASRGSHVVLEKRFLSSDHALLVPKTRDGRVLFAIPWQGRVVAGTTDVPVEQVELEPRPAQSEIDFILGHLGQYLDRKPTRDDVLSVFSGLRPLVGTPDRSSTKTSTLSRDHVIEVLGRNFLSVMGGKWTTYRKMAEEAVNRAAEVANLRPRKSVTRNLDLTEYTRPENGSRTVLRDEELGKIIEQDPGLAVALHSAFDYSEADVVHAVRHEWACTLEDVMARRTRMLLQDARASQEVALKVSEIMAQELGMDESWKADQIQSYRDLVTGYLPG